jgi:hypothetical protein
LFSCGEKGAIQHRCENQDALTMKKLLVLAALASAIQMVSAADIFYVANLDPSGEHAGVSSRSGSGTANLTLNGTSLSWTVSYSGLSGISTASHIHGPAAVGTDAAVEVTLAQPSQLGFTSGSFSGSGTISQTVIDQMNNGLAYVNLHSSTFGGGEIRGQVALVPEPTTMALFAGAGVMMMALRRKRS